jgi:hypothetical protein
MRNLIGVSVLILVGIAGCKQPTGKPVVNKPSNVVVQPKPAAPVMPSFNSPIILDSLGDVMFALLVKDDDDNHGLISKSSGREAATWNIVFYNTESKKYHLLDDGRKMLITGFGGAKASYSDVEVISDESGALNGLIYYSVIISDYNADGKLNRDDPKYLFISDKQGNNFRQISPDNQNVISWEAIKKTGKLLIETVKDSNNDKKFDGDDEDSPYVYDIKSGGVAQPIFTTEFKSHVNALFKKQWPAE